VSSQGIQLFSKDDPAKVIVEREKEPCFTAAIAPLEALQGECADSWLQKNPDGRCTFTNCYVGIDGDPNDCVVCERGCDNGCGPASIPLLNTDGDFFFFDFGPACCNHDYCWSSTFSKATCDFDFYSQMLDQCPPVIVSVFAIFLPLPLAVPLQACRVLATVFYLAVNVPVIATQAYEDAQNNQTEYEKEDVCIAKCPSTQESGGQGTTVLTIDLKNNTGTFPVQYEMYSIPDQLYIEYEGTRIFDTGGLISGSGSVDVSFSGVSAIIQVTIFAPNSGTVWDVSIGCPYGISG
jgi:3D (Asp-Asp-Asp) domain-containing protein